MANFKKYKILFGVYQKTHYFWIRKKYNNTKLIYSTTLNFIVNGKG